MSKERINRNNSGRNQDSGNTSRSLQTPSLEAFTQTKLNKDLLDLRSM